MSPTDVTIEILKSIREEVKYVRTELSGRIVESEVRTATAITDLHGTLREVLDVLRDQHDLRPRVDRCERDIGDIKQRLGI
jgi:hypothetical protein